MLLWRCVAEIVFGRALRRIIAERGREARLSATTYAMGKAVQDGTLPVDRRPCVALRWSVVASLTCRLSLRIGCVWSSQLPERSPSRHERSCYREDGQSAKLDVRHATFRVRDITSACSGSAEIVDVGRLRIVHDSCILRLTMPKEVNPDS